MRKITIFTVPKSFVGKYDMFQRNAIRSWLSLKPTPEIILCGKDPGIAEIAVELGVVHLPDVAITIGGTPLYNSVFSKAQAIAKNSVVAYLNSDIILTNDFLDTVDVVSSKLKKFMIVGRRTDLAIADYIDFADPLWEKKLRIKAKSGKLHPPCAMDYHIFEKGVGTSMPPFVIGRIAWDNWFPAIALQHGFNVVDASEKILAIHQEHVSLGDYKIKENMTNLKLAKKHRQFSSEANWGFANNELVKTENFDMWQKKSALHSSLLQPVVCDAGGFPKFKNSKEKIVISIGHFKIEEVKKHLKFGYSVVSYTPSRKEYNDYLDIGNLKFAPYNFAILDVKGDEAKAFSIHSVLEKFDKVDILYLNCEGEEVPIVLNNPIDLFLRCKKIIVEFQGYSTLQEECLKKWEKAFAVSKLDSKPTYRFMRKS
ncbi:MAG TPA: hypothetical protein VMX17_14175 [Candidatus Glassbacteria bacterium]|nr:hypothetical protein [Candidatus Glassbacteria bacterium]